MTGKDVFPLDINNHEIVAPALIYHICNRRDWERAQETGEYRADSLAMEGFIHFSTPAQLARTANRFFRDQQDLILLSVNSNCVRPELRYEGADGDLFPHLYGPLNLDAVVAAADFSSDQNLITE